MLTKYKNVLFELIRRENFAPDMLSYRENSYEAMVVLNETPHRFILANYPQSFDHFIVRHTRFAPGIPYTKWTGPNGDVESPMEMALDSIHSLDQIQRPIAYNFGEYRPMYRMEDYGDINFVSERFVTWLAYDVVKHIEAHTVPDLWEQLSAFGDFSNWSEQNEYQPFTTEQKVFVKQYVQNFRVLLIHNYSPSDERLTAINEKLDYLTAAVDRLNRFDWKGTLINIAIDICTALSLDTTQRQQVFVLLQQALGSVMKFLGSGG